MTHEFWDEGPWRTYEATKRQRAELERLGKQLRRAEEPEERRRIEERIHELRMRYSPSEAEIDESLFLLG